VLVSEIIDRAINEFLYPAGVDRPSYDTLAGGIDASELTIPLTGRVDNVPEDTILQIGSELILVEEVVGTTVTAKVRGYLETGGATHASGDIVEVDPTYYRTAILNALKGVIGMLRPWGLPRIVTDTTQTFTTREVIDLPAGTRKVRRIEVLDSGSYETYTTLKRQGEDWIFYPYLSPPKLHLRRRGPADGQAMTIIYEKDFTLPAAEADDVTTVCGVPDTLAPHLPMGVAGAVLAGKESSRVHIEAIRRLLASQGVQVGASMNLSQTLTGLFRTNYVLSERKRLDELEETGVEWIRSR
jgi:hypothetical protein